jgi:hypothetical protein
LNKKLVSRYLLIIKQTKNRQVRRKRNLSYSIKVTKCNGFLVRQSVYNIASFLVQAAPSLAPEQSGGGGGVGGGVAEPAGGGRPQLSEELARQQQTKQNH